MRKGRYKWIGKEINRKKTEMIEKSLRKKREVRGRKKRRKRRVK